MLQKMAMRMALLTSAAASPIALALGLGEIQVSSHLNQPLSASIPLLALTADEAENLQVRLASAADFDHADVERKDYLSTLTFKVEGSRVLIGSSRIAREPVIPLLVEARSGNSRILRGYTVLLDPPDLQQTASAAAPEIGRESVETPAATRRVAATRSTPTSFDTVGPVRSGQTFWGIAESLCKRYPGVTTEQMMLALYQTNPAAFTGGIDGLLTGAILRVPTESQALATRVRPAREAVAQLARGSVAGSADRASTAAAAPAESGEPSTPAPAPVPMQAITAPAESRVQTTAAAPADAKPPAAVSKADESADIAHEPAATDGEAPVATAAQPTQKTAAPPDEAPPAASSMPAAAPAGVIEKPGAAASPLSAFLPVAALLILWLLIALSRRSRRGNTAGNAAVVPVVAPIAAEPAESSRSTIELPPAATETAVFAAPQLIAPEAVQATHTIEFDLAPSSYTELAAPPVLGDPIAEADFHIAYGFYDEAARGLLLAIAQDASRLELQLKLAETWFVAGKAAEFEALALRLKPGLGVHDWGRLASMGARLCPESPLFAGDVSRLDYTREELLAVQSEPASMDLGNRVELDLVSPPEREPFLSLEEFDLGDDVLEADPESSIATDDEIGTKLDLARAYLDMGDDAMAHSLLAEVAEEGDAVQKADARALLQRLSP